jgi:hypothetical protein
MIIPLIL